MSKVQSIIIPLKRWVFFGPQKNLLEENRPQQSDRHRTFTPNVANSSLAANPQHQWVFPHDSVLGHLYEA